MPGIGITGGRFGGGGGGSASITLVIYSDAGHTTPITQITAGDTAYLLATPSNITPTTYHFFLYDQTSGYILSITDSASASTSWVANYSGTFDFFVIATDDETNWVGQSMEFEVPIDPDAATFIVAHNAASGLSMDSVQVDAVDGLVTRLKGIGTPNESDLFTTMQSNGDRLYIFAPVSDSVVSAAAYAINLIDPTESGSFVNTVSGDFTVEGVKGGTAKYFDLGLAPDDFPQNDFGFDFYSVTDAVNTKFGMGVNSPVPQAHMSPNYTGNGALLRINTSTLSFLAQADSLGLYSGNRDNSATQELYKNGVLIDTRAAVSSGRSTNHMYGLAINNGGSSDFNDGDRRYALFAMRHSFTADQLEDFNYAVNWYQTNIITGGRNV
jgi:hypothetical protein